ncbi:single-stranded DNA-binding protein [Micromonospora sonchi]|uniref:Single-stranded DNA-binding protein n=1 Tax=Micromonospora sonchi TaxID=1763543 RepID=A0A917TKN9_9ACTN|nr:single-stranded DNA-binding protein [Micromonospora sonchi]GGM26841.1 single-stranded DNA-binding protein [Micromonospora sonchi]
MSLPPIFGTARLLDDPELRFAPSGVAVCRVRLAFNSRRKNPETQQWEDADTLFVDGTVFKQEAENVAESLMRGAEVVVYGRLKTERYETREGEKRSAMKLMIDGIGPSLKFATARPQKLARSSNGQGNGGGDDPWSTGAPAASGARSGGGNFDEEPPF